MEAKKLVLENSNHCLETDVFTVINICPPPERLPPYNTICDPLYVVTHNGADIYVRIVDVWFSSFRNITDFQTLWATGRFADEWRQDFKEKHPEVEADTKCMIVCYKREFL